MVQGAGGRLTLTADDLLRCYASGVFPMGEARDDAPLERFHIPSRLARTVRQDRFEVTVDQDFAAVLDGCAAAAPDREDTWINGPIRRLYLELHARGHARSVECLQGGLLVGGLYGVTLGGAFFGESMFSRARDASKIALVHLVARLRRGGWTLLDAQFLTQHLTQFGAVEIPQGTYLRMLKVALRTQPDPRLFSEPLGGAEALTYALQPTTQAS